MATAGEPRILVVGCGGIGGIVAAGLLNVGHHVTPLTKNELIADAINTYGFRTQGEQALGAVPGKAVHVLDKDAGFFDFVLLCTQPPQVEEAAKSVLPHLAEDGSMVVFQNGICEPRIAAIAGADRVIGAIISWGATMVEPGVYDRTSSGGFTLGRIDGAPDGRVHLLEGLLEAVGPVALTENLMGARWSKLAINCAISSLGTVGGDRLGALLRRRYVRRLALEIMTETVEVARAEEIRLEKVSGTLDLEWIALTADERAATLGSPGLFAKHALLLAVGTRYRRLRSSMLNAIERGRPVGVDFLNGEVVERGQKHGVPTPINAALLDEVNRIAKGKRQPSQETLLAFFRTTRTLLAQPSDVPVETVPPPVDTLVEPPPEPTIEEAPPPSLSPPSHLESTLPSPGIAAPKSLVDERVEEPVEERVEERVKEPVEEPAPPEPPPPPEPPAEQPAEPTPEAATSEPSIKPDEPYFPGAEPKQEPEQKSKDDA